MTPVIPRSATPRIAAIRGLKFLTRDRLIVHFEEDGREARRYILLPGTLQDGGSGGREVAVAMLREQGWPVEGARGGSIRSENRRLRGALL